jgi:hypothetical protein
MDETEVGLNAGRGRSPGGTGRLFPDGGLVTLDGRSLSLERYRSRWNLVILMLGAAPMTAPAEQLLGQLAGARAELEAEDGQVLAVLADVPTGWRGEWPYPFPLVFDADASLHRRVAAVDAGGQPDVALYITDRYREIFILLRPGDASWPTSARGVLEWLTFVSIQCPECNAPEA